MSRQHPADKLSGAVSAAVLDYVSESTGPALPFDLAGLQAWAAIMAQGQRHMASWVIGAKIGRVAGDPVSSWSEIGAALGITKQAAAQRFSAAVAQAQDDRAHGWPYWWRIDNGTCARCTRPMANPGAAHQPRAARPITLDDGSTATVCRECAADRNTRHVLLTDRLDS